eukprot:SAG31_NODE_127_length_23612_cov_39.709863_5_plen_186_part_00
MPPIARLAQLVRQLTLAPSSAAGAGALPGDSQSAADEQARGEESALRLLSADQMADFVAKGYVLVQPKEGDELPSGFHANFYDRVDDLMRNPIHEGHRDLGLMTPQINTLLRTPSCHGALRSVNISKHPKTSQDISRYLKISQNISKHLKASQNISDPRRELRDCVVGQRHAAAAQPSGYRPTLA